MSDLFHEELPNETLDTIFATMALAHRLRAHTFQVLTKRPARMLDYWRRNNPGRFADIISKALHISTSGPEARTRCKGLDNAPGGLIPIAKETGHTHLLGVWLGVSVEDQRRADERMPLLLRTPAALRFASVEPMLGPVDLRPWLSDGRRLDWVIVGGESGPGARPCKLSWIREIVDQCARAGVPVFVKQLGRRAWHDDKPLDLKDSKGGDPAEWPLDDVDQLRQFPA